MGMPTSATARLFYRCAWERLDEAKILWRSELTTSGPMYLAGYTIECVLKALILSITPSVKQDEVLQSFRGSKGHNYEWLREQYRQSGGAQFTPAVTRSFALVSDWSTEMRYIPRNYPRPEIEAFLKATQEIMNWADGRL